MDVFTLLFGGILALAMVYLVMRLSYVIFVNVITGMRFRKMLATRVHKLRLNRMLAALGIDTNTYVHNERIVDIENQMSNCSSCENVDICDEQLTSGEVNADNIDYCNNEAALKEMVENAHIKDALPE